SVTANHTISATFAINTYTVTPSAGPNGSIDPSTPQPVSYDGTASFTVMPATGYSASVTGSCGGALAGSIYTTGQITGDCSVAAAFAINTYTITVSPGANGTITGPAGVNYGDSPTYTITPNSGYSVTDVLLDGSSVFTACSISNGVATYTIVNVTSAHTISAVFTQLYTYYQDLDGDGYGNPNVSITSSSPTPPAGYVTDNTDCNDTNASIHPGAANVCGQDMNCTGTPYEGPECSGKSESVAVPADSSGPLPFSPGEPYWVTATFSNGSEQTIQTIRPDCYNSVFTLMDSNGRVPAPLCNIGPAYGIPNDVISLAPGQSFEVDCNLAELYRPEALVPGQFTLIATYANNLTDPDIVDGQCMNQPCSDLWTGAVSAPQTSLTISGPRVIVTTGSLTLSPALWNAGWSAQSGGPLTATLSGIPSGSTVDTVTLNGIASTPGTIVGPDANGNLKVQFGSQAGVSSLGTIAQTVFYPTVEAKLSSGNFVRGKTQITMSNITSAVSLSSSPNP